ncbi:hypothetical protein [Dyella sp. A6]|uniref:hypothetical protein n=1 Tax=Dyella aluminiiresistens TaxID=3069105 RepID=UPI002E79A550|nr:hypothetical protein [Dyella sp. A6]
MRRRLASSSAWICATASSWVICGTGAGAGDVDTSAADRATVLRPSPVVRTAAFFVTDFLGGAFFTASFLAAGFAGAAFFAVGFCDDAFLAVLAAVPALWAADFLAVDLAAARLPVADVLAAGGAAATFLVAAFFAGAPATFLEVVRETEVPAEDFFAADLRVVAMRSYSFGCQYPSMDTPIMTRT